jgi:hypothetical protein
LDDVDGVDAAGSVTVFVEKRGVWLEQAKLTADVPGDNDEFGTAVALSHDGNRLLVGAPGAGTGGAGAAYVFVRQDGTWEMEAFLTAPDAGVAFGSAVALSADAQVAIIGDWADDQTTGSAYVFEREAGWVFRQKLTASDGSIQDRFGISVALSQNDAMAVVGASGWNVPGVGGTGPGAVYVFEHDGNSYIETDLLTADDGDIADWFGISVAASANGNLIVVGAIYDDDLGNGSGAVYLLSRSNGTWSEAAKLTASDSFTLSAFGFSPALAVDTETLVVGAPAPLQEPANGGSVYAFLVGGEDCNSNGVADGCDVMPVEHIYHVDDATHENIIGIQGGGGMIWLNEMRVVSGAETITEVRLAWGDVPTGTLARIALWHDPDGDGDPIDAELLTVVEGVSIEQPNSGEFQTVAVPPTAVGVSSDHFFVGAHVDHIDDQYPAAIDEDWPTFHSWIAFGDNLENLAANAYILPIDFFDLPGDWLVRAVDDPSPFSRDDDGDILPDECACPWDLDTNSGVGIGDLLALLAAWGTDPGGPPDFDGDGVVGITDLLEILSNWGPCT